MNRYVLSKINRRTNEEEIITGICGTEEQIKHLYRVIDKLIYTLGCDDNILLSYKEVDKCQECGEHKCFSNTGGMDMKNSIIDDLKGQVYSALGVPEELLVRDYTRVCEKCYRPMDKLSGDICSECEGGAKDDR